jgi:hypothetical protein
MSADPEAGRSEFKRNSLPLGTSGTHTKRYMPSQRKARADNARKRRVMQCERMWLIHISWHTTQRKAKLWEAAIYGKAYPVDMEKRWQHSRWYMAAILLSMTNHFMLGVSDKLQVKSHTLYLKTRKVTINTNILFTDIACIKNSG